MAEKAPAKDTETAKETAPRTWHVIDSTAVHGATRTHEQIVDGRVKSFSFEAGKPVAMPSAIAIKFLRDPAFIRTDENGKEIRYERTPRQPDELGAGEKLVLRDNETVARYDELSIPALVQRVAVLPGGEKFALTQTKPDREEMIAFVVAAKLAMRKANAARAPDVSKDDFVPEADSDDLEDAA